MEQKEILVVGSLNMDLVVKLVDMPKVGETVLGRDIHYVPGGKGANQSFAATRLGGKVTMLGKVGDDDFGKTLVNHLNKAGVNTSAIGFEKDCSTGLAIIYVNNEGDNSIAVIPGANARCDINYIESHLDKIRKADLIMMQMEIPMETVRYVIEVAHQYNKQLILNPAPAPDFIEDDLYKRIHYLTPNETELAKLTGYPADTMDEIIKASQYLIEKGVKKVLVTCGDRGAVLVDQASHRHYTTHKVEAIDTTAAGDSFNAAVAVKLMEGSSEEEAIQFANKVSGIVVTRVGAQSSIPSRQEVEEVR